ncbi:hypothetical protein [Bacillus mesophilus]|uniref:Transporter n=1 Tax=Bacillus mesophilus TaxID=1808955 RepID=A0A6M0QBC1_9BACI|nr:hypothetical protein [Bacillus mesophilus]NEY72810.1 hypothetical protein [Bacillus mesophilus]
MYNQDVYSHSIPYLPNDFFYVNQEERQLIPGFPSFGGIMGPPSGIPSTPPPLAPPSQGMQAGPPTSPPPSYIPTQTQQAQAFAVDPGSIRGCLFRYTYVWLRGFQQFWFYPTFVGRTSVSGYRWNGFRWVYSGISLRQIQSFTCI